MDNSISNLNAVSVLSINDTLPIVNGGETKKVTLQQVIEKVFNNVTGYVRYIIRDYNTYSYTGTTAETLISSTLIPANAFNAQDTFTISNAIFSKTGASVPTFKIYINTTNSLSGASLISPSLAYVSTVLAVNFKRTFILNGGLLKFMSSITASDNLISQIALSSVAYNPTQPIYLLFTSAISIASDTVTQEALMITN